MINLGEFEYWENINTPAKGFVNDEFNGFELWEDYNTTGEIFGEAGVTPTSSSNFFLFFN